MRHATYDLKQTAFSLVELVIVIVIIGIIAAIAVPRVSRGAAAATEASLYATVRNIGNQIQIYYAVEKAYPDDIDPAWFSSGRIFNPYEPDHPIPVKVQNISGKQHPRVKAGALNGAFWYNRANGIFRGRADPQLSDPEIIELYNRINRTNVTLIDQTG